MTDGPSIPPPLGGNSSLVTRVINILTKPAAEWQVIAAEPTSNGKLIGGYAAILAVLAPVFTLLYLLLSPLSSVIFHMPLVLILSLVFNYLIALVVPVAVAFIVDALTTQLGGVKNSQNAMKLVIYSATGYWVASIGIILSPWLWLVIGLGYAGFLLWVGTPILMKTSTEKSPIFVGATIGIWLGVYIVASLIFQKILESMLYNAMLGAMRGAYGM